MFFTYLSPLQDAGSDDKTDVGEVAFGDVEDLVQGLNSGFQLEDLVEEAGEDDLLAMRRAICGDDDDDDDKDLYQ